MSSEAGVNLRGALVALEQAIGVGAQWVGRELGGDARERFLLHLRTELLSDDDGGSAG